MMSESEMNLWNQLLATHDRDESIKIARKLFPEMPLDKLTEVVDESLAGYREASAAKRKAQENIS